MKRLVKKSMSLVLALLMMFSVFAGTTSVFADEGELKNKVISNLSSEIGWFDGKITGTVDISKTVSNTPLKLKEGTNNTYTGILSGSVQSGDLFDGAFKMYKNEFENLELFGRPWKNIVMFGATKNSFPTCSYKVTFPDNITIDKTKVVATENTNAISKIEIKAEDHSVTFTFYLGNWNDYAGFFKFVEKDMNEVENRINISIPYTVEVNDSSTNILGTIKGSGECKLYKFGSFSLSHPIVELTSPEINFNVINPK